MSHLCSKKILKKNNIVDTFVFQYPEERWGTLLVVFNLSHSVHT